MPDMITAFDMPTAPTPDELGKLDLNDYGNAIRLMRLAGAAHDLGQIDTRQVTLLYQKGAGWVGFNGRYWDQKYGEQLALRLAHQVAQKMRAPEVREQISKNHGIDASGKDMTRYLDGLGQAGASTAMLRQAAPYLTVEIDAFDQHPMALNCRNGTLWMTHKKGEFAYRLKSHSPADRLTKMMDLDYDKAAKAPLFRKVVSDSLDKDDIRAFFHRYMGYSFTGHTYEQAFVICQGKGQDGKSTILDAVRCVGGGYAAQGDVFTFLETGANNASGPQPDLIKLAGDVRMVLLSEPPRGAKLNEGRIKAWTGGTPITARPLREAPIEFIPAGKLIMECNSLPVVRGDDEGIWRRTLVVPFENPVPKAQLDRQLPKKLKDEYPGILNWIVEGVGDWLAQGLDPPEAIASILDDYRKESSPFGDWLTERCVFGKDALADPTTARTLASVLYNDYKEWAEAQGHDKPMSQRAFGSALSQRQIRLAGKDGQGRKFRSPIRLKTSWELDADNEKSGASATDRGPAASPENDPFSMEGFD